MRLIDADALMDDVMKRYCKDCDKRKGIKSGKWRIIYEIGDAPCRACSVDDMKAELEDAPTIEERKKGKWIGEPKDGIEAMFFKPKCSVCGFESAEVKNFCPVCGADMRGDKDE